VFQETVLPLPVLEKGQYETTVDERSLPEGITSFYLFDKNFKLLSERSVYVHANNINVSIKMDKNIYARRDKVLMNLSATDVTQRAVPSLVAVAVSDSAFSYKLQQCSFSNMPSDLRMVDNLFLAGNNCFSDEEIDLVMLVKSNTYQTLTTGSVQSNKTDNDSLLYIKGAVLNDKNEPLTNKLITILSKSESPVFYRDTTDSKGRFCFPFESLIDSTEFIIEVKDIKKGSQDNKIAFDTIAYPRLNTPTALKQYPALEPALTKKRFDIYYQAQSLEETENQLPTVTITDSSQANYDVSKRVNPFSAIISGEDLDGRQSLDNVILRVSGLQVINGFLIMRGLNSFNNPGPQSEPLVVVDGSAIPISGGDNIGTSSPVLGYLRSIDPRNVDFVEVLKDGDASAYGVRGGNGVILINSSNKHRSMKLDKNNMQTFYGKGVAKPVSFPELNFGKKTKKAAPADDYRSTVFWNGNLRTSDANSSTISFYTSDVPSVYNVTVTGVTAYGDIIYKTVAVQSK
jgi:hypothetical protein